MFPNFVSTFQKYIYIRILIYRVWRLLEYEYPLTTDYRCPGVDSSCHLQC